jgi:predicted GIY-YIG superfamily endonuclease
MISTSNLVYCITTTAEKTSTYIGVTNNAERRLAQHNGLRAGGARYTRSKGPWHAVFHVCGFLTRGHALQLEWLLHKARRCLPPPPASGNPFGKGVAARRAWTLYAAFRRDRFTRKSPLTQHETQQWTIRWMDARLAAVATSAALQWPANLVHSLSSHE